MAPVRCLLAIGALTACLWGLVVQPARADDAERGAKLYTLCAQCHGPDGAGDRRFLAPAIAGLDEWYVLVQLGKFRSGQRGTHFDDLSGMRMRPMSLTLRSEEDVATVAKHVASMPRTNPDPQLEGGDAARGQATYAALCVSCHGAQGEGLQPLNGPRLAGASDWYLADQLHKFKVGVRGADPRDPIAIMMRPMAMTLADDQAVLDVVAYIATLAR